MILECKQIKDLANEEKFYYNGRVWEYVFEVDDYGFRKGFNEGTNETNYFTLDLWVITDKALLDLI
jgi:hypothetical protein